MIPDRYLYIPLSIKQLKQMYKELTDNDATIKEIDNWLIEIDYKLQKLPYWSTNFNVKFMITKR